ncbi:glycoside hydrolase family 38 N-terminal domain-containing protein [Lactococcus garvieae]|uniref:glycoside hydrolase family 38 N-terminal domain-containing protein n=1 Tax=Lactococcus garvieae TaxID=1363 RepID=UPI0038533DB8
MEFNIISHTHWDREWHKTFQEYRVRLVSFFDNLIDLLEKDSEYESFLMDGQTVVLEDYLQIKPYKRQQLEQLIKNGRLIVGPWYIQPDEFIPSGEMQIRNLLVGQTVGSEFGANMQVGYLPDSFGQSAQIPQLLNGFGIEHAVFWRGITEEECKNLDFIWQSDDGSQVKTTVLADGYGNARLFNDSLKNNIQIVEENLERLYEKSNKENLLLMCGFDQRKANASLPQIVKDLNGHYGGEHTFKISTLPEYLEKAFQTENKEIVSGEFRKGKHMRVHVSIGLTRSDIKQANYQAQTSLVKIAEPLASLASMHGLEYQKELFTQAAKYTLQNQAHDSISNVCTDATHREMSLRYENAQQISNLLANDALDYMTNQIDFQDIGQPIVLFNLTSSKRNVLEKIQVTTELENFDLLDNKKNKVPFEILSKEVTNQNDKQIEIGVKNKDKILYQYELLINLTFEGWGYQTIYLVEGQEEQEKSKSPIYDELTQSFVTDYYTLEIQKNGQLSYIDKKTGERFDSLNSFVENGNAGDEYDYSPPVQDQKVSAHNHQPEIQILHNSATFSEVKLVYRFDVPRETNGQERSKEVISQHIETSLMVKKDSPKVEIKTWIDNQAKNHRICVQFDSNEASDEHFSEQQFGPITRRNTIDNPNQWQEENWEERYYPIYPQQRYTGFDKDNGKLLVLNKGLVTYEILEHQGKPRLSLPLITTMDYMGKQDLLDRPGRRSGLHVATPDSEMIGQYTYEYAFLFVQPEENMIAHVEAYQMPLMSKQSTSKAKGTLADHFTLHSISHSNVEVMALKKAENRPAYIFRLVNHEQTKVENVELRFDSTYFGKVEEVNFNEEILNSNKRFTFEDGILNISELNANEVISFSLSN